MQRRRVLRAGLAALTVVTGCLGTPPANGGSDGDSSPTPDVGESTTATEGPRVTGRRFTAIEGCPDPGRAQVAVEDRTVAVDGCIQGANGCTVAELDTVRYDPGADTLTVAVGTREERAPNEGCTQALVDRGYRVRVALSGGHPGTVVVVHEGAYGRREVGRWSE